MRCNNCGINYDDQDKECPMCGAKAGHGTHANVSRYTSSSHTTHDAKDCTHKTFTHEQSFSAPRGGSLNGVAARKPKQSGVGIVAIVIAILLSVGAPVIGMIADWVQEYGVVAPMPDMPLDTNALGSTMLDVSILAGKIWQAELGDDAALALEINDADYYRLYWVENGATYIESGSVYMWTETGSSYFSEQFPPDKYDAFTLNLERSAVESSTGTLPVSLMPNNERDIFLTMYHEIGKPNDVFHILSEYEEGAPIFPDAPIMLLQRLDG